MRNLCHLCGNLGPLLVALPTSLEERSRADKRGARRGEDIRSISSGPSLCRPFGSFQLVSFLVHVLWFPLHKTHQRTCHGETTGKNLEGSFCRSFKCQIRLRGHISTVSFNILDA